MAFVVLCDACVLHPAPLRDLLIRLGRTGIVRARWSELIPDDRHVLAAAIKANAQVIVTANLSDFPTEKLAPFNIEAKHPDELVLDLIDLAPAKVLLVVSQQAAGLKSPPRTVNDILDTLQEQGLVQSVAKLRELLGPAETG